MPAKWQCYWHALFSRVRCWLAGSGEAEVQAESLLQELLITPQPSTTGSACTLGNEPETLTSWSPCFCICKTRRIKIAVCTSEHCSENEMSCCARRQSCDCIASAGEIKKCIWIAQGGRRKPASKISQGLSMMKFPVISGLRSSCCDAMGLQLILFN